MSSPNKLPGTPWPKGVSGNPKGRLPGRSAITKMRESLAADVPDILAGLVMAAKGGDVQAARLILERVLPTIKPIEQPQELDLPSDGTPTTQGRAVMVAIVSGEIAPGHGAALLGALGVLVKLNEADEMSRRLALIEGVLKIKGKI